MEMIMVYSTGRGFHDHVRQEYKSAMDGLASIPPMVLYLQASPFWESVDPCDSYLDGNYDAFLFPLVQRVAYPCIKSTISNKVDKLSKNTRHKSPNDTNMP
jgi:hypothetical protein